MKIKEMFNRETVAALAASVHDHYPDFDQQAFAARIFDAGWEALELKQRMRHITHVFHDCLPASDHAALGILRPALASLAGRGFGGYGIVALVFPDYVEVYGIEDWDASIPALEEFTQVISAEFAIRPFIVRYQDRTMAQMLAWTDHQNAEVRRLASEGCRPRLPWGIALPALKANPHPILPILERLKQDPSKSVRRSVANNLNDISKDNADFVLSVLRRWQAEGSPEIHRITSHALRTLVKQGHPEALELLGYPSDAAIAVRNLSITPDAMRIGETVTLTFDIKSLANEAQNLMIDYVVYHMRASGELTPKVFKLAKRSLQPGQTLHITKSHSFAPVTTRRYYPGQHAIEPKINGKLWGRIDFVLS